MRVIFLGLILFFSQITFADDLTLAKEITLNSEFLKEKRNLLISLPDEYEDSDATFPVLYLLHAQWDMLPTLSTIDLLEDQIPNFIIIGVESKGKELRPDGGKATPFSNYLTQEVLPYINQHYRAAPFNILSGHSNSGRFVLDYWLSNKPLFSQYYAFSPSLDDGYIVERVTKLSIVSLKDKAPLIVSLANEGDHMQTPFDEFHKLMSRQADSRSVFKKFPEQSHRTTKHPSMQFALQSTFENWKPSYEVRISGLEGLKSHYAALTKKFGFKTKIPTETLQRLSYHYAMIEGEQAKDQLEQHIAFTISQSKEGADALFEIADYLTGNSHQRIGESMFNRICSHVKKHSRCTQAK